MSKKFDCTGCSLPYESYAQALVPLTAIQAAILMPLEFGSRFSSMHEFELVEIFALDQEDLLSADDSEDDCSSLASYVDNMTM